MTWLRNPMMRLALATAVMVITTRAAEQEGVSPLERDAFKAINELPDGMYRPVWMLMQLGTLGAAPAAATLAYASGNRRLASALVLDGTATWALSKVVKGAVRRPRPAALLPSTHRRGADAAGLGYLSGHAGVATALGTAMLPSATRAERAIILAAATGVGLSRMYVGAHLPLDVIGGAALGIAVEAATSILRSHA